MSLTDTPEVYVNEQLIPASAIDAEIQYHPAPERREAMIKATESLIIGELFRQRAVELSLIDAEQSTCPDDVIDQLIDQEVAHPKATDDEIERFYQTHQERFSTSPLVEVKHILISSDPMDQNHRFESKDLATNIIKQLQQTPSDWASLLKQHSDCPSKSTDGHLGQVSAGQTVKEFEKVIFKADQGLVAHPIETRYGFHIAFIERKINGKLLPFEHVKKDIEEYLNEKVRHKGIAQYIQILADEAEIKGFTFVRGEGALVQ